MQSPADHVVEDLLQIGVLLLDAEKNLLNHHVLAAVLLKIVVGLLGVRELRTEAADGDIVEALGLLLVGNSLVLHLCLLHLGGKQLVVVLRVHLLLLILHITVRSNLLRDLFELADALINGLVELHRVLSRVLQGLLEVRNLARQFTLGC